MQPADKILVSSPFFFQEPFPKEHSQSANISLGERAKRGYAIKKNREKSSTQNHLIKHCFPNPGTDKGANPVKHEPQARNSNCVRKSPSLKKPAS